MEAGIPIVFVMINSEDYDQLFPIMNDLAQEFKLQFNIAHLEWF